MATLRFRDWGVQYANIKPGDPVSCDIRGASQTRQFVGYIHEIKPMISPGANLVEITVIGASYRLKQARQRVFESMTASDIVKQIADEYGFAAYIEAHPRVYDQVTQAGHSELQIMSRLAKQCGYSLRVENTSIHFKSLTYDYTNSRDNAHTFTMRDSNDPKGSTLYSFNLTLGDSIMYRDAYKSAVQIGGVDPYTAQLNVVTNDRGDTLRETSAIEFFDSFSTTTVAPGLLASSYEAKAADERNRFPYRARIQVLGTPDLRPDMPVYLDGIGPQYSGYWVVLYSEHSIIEEKPNIYKYITTVDVGADSIGQAQVWKGQAITAPSDVKVRVLVPDTRNVPDTTSSTLTQGTGTYANDGFNEVQNRTTPSNVRPYVWIAVSPSDNPYSIDLRNRSDVVVKRLESKGVL
jgi:phage protein D